jgi:hypothetical protein
MNHLIYLMDIMIVIFIHSDRYRIWDLQLEQDNAKYGNLNNSFQNTSHSSVLSDEIIEG